MVNGTIEQVIDGQDRGFVRGSDGKRYHFYMNKVIEGPVKKGDPVLFDFKETPKGLSAFNIRLDASTPAASNHILLRPEARAASPRQPAARGGSFRQTEPVYRFAPRAGDNTAVPEAKHDQLLSGHYDIAMEIDWETVTPTALNPAESDRTAPDAVSSFKGYQRAWLRSEGKLAISPFTVKGAIANGMANLLGGCYRMMDPPPGVGVVFNQLHSDVIPEGNQLCTSVGRLCPRCALFGTATEHKDAVGYRGRFKASALNNTIELKPATEERDYSHFLSGQQKILVEEWHAADGSPVTAMELLPIAMESKPYGKYTKAKYFDEDNRIRGAKYFPHEQLTTARNIKGVDQKPRLKHQHRTFAEVCERGVMFSGTIGGENCSLQEVAALIVLLHSPAFGHGFKLGIGKFFGLGSVKSSIRHVWVRSSQNYIWEKTDQLQGLERQAFIDKLTPLFPDIETMLATANLNHLPETGAPATPVTGDKRDR